MEKQYMRLLLLILTFALTSTAKLSAQHLIGGGMVFGTDNSNIGLMPKALYALKGPWYLSPSLVFFFPYENNFGGNVHWAALNADVHLYVPLDEQSGVYPLLGLNVSRVAETYDRGSRQGEEDVDIGWGLNIGAGVRHQFNRVLGLGGEVKLVTGRNDQVELAIFALLALPSP